MKKVVSILLTASMIASSASMPFTAVAAETTPVTTITTPTVDDPSVQTAVVTVTIMDISGDNILVKPVDGSPELKSSSKFSLSAKQLPADINPKIGMKLEITYNGGILESYPAMFGNVQKVVEVKEDTVKEDPTLLKGTKDMTLNDVIELAKKGNELDWADFKDYKGRDVGSGLYIWEFTLEDGYVLDVGGTTDKKPLYILLSHDDDKGVDIRTNDVEKYITSMPFTAVAAETTPVTTITTSAVDDPIVQTAVVTVTIIDISGDNILVKPIDGSPELKSSSKFSLSAKQLPADINPKVDMKLEITYNGGILETYPAEFSEIKKVTVLKTFTVLETYDTYVLVSVDGSRLFRDLMFLYKKYIGSNIDPVPGMKLTLGYSGILETFPGQFTGVHDVKVVSENAGLIKGDSNCDGSVDMADVVFIMQALANPDRYGEKSIEYTGITALGKLNGDMNGDGLTVGDAQAIQIKLLGLDNDENTDNDVTPSEPTTIGFSNYEEYKKYIEENNLADKIVTYDKLSQYGEFVQFTINSHWMYDNTFSLFYIFNDGSGKNYDLIIHDRPQQLEDLVAYPKLTDDLINKSDMRTANTDADAYYEFDNKYYIYTNGKLSQIKWFDDKHIYILIGNPMLYDYPKVDNTYMSKLLDISSTTSTDNSVIAGKIFAYEKEGAGGYCTLSFNENGRFLYSPGKLSSYMSGGDWKIDGDTVSLIGMADKTIYLKITDDTLVYIAEGSDEFPYMDIKDGEKFGIYRPEISSDKFRLNARYSEYGLGDPKVELDLIASELPEFCYVENVSLYDEDDNFIGTMSPAMDADIWSYLVDCHVTEECSKTYYTLTRIRCGAKTYLDDVRSEITVNFKVAPAP
ncbi:hypothetical protein [Ruminococcus flavefaciens]|uniref:hypothetical protein n=1 Tax=Ruminococcus flavefaciens TaxID=1265 RepID=UPI0026EC43F1|nr:hypothetical protein [Ruminococcus flavefaciens]MDD7516398.1 hypothetical protein [Ruminococcus flavefaciens]MDY5691531.1 hypothetical protein [Ruminococcus flavefaciens]